MSSDQINENKDNLNMLRLVMKRKLHSGTERVDVIGKRQKVSSLDGYRKSLQRKNMKNDDVNDDDERITPLKIAAKKRLQNELKEFILSSPACISAYLKEDSLFEWEASIQGPQGTPYEGGTFILDLSFPATYPFKPPKVTFKTKIYH